MEQIGETIRRARKERRLTQADLAAAMGMSRATISGIENGTVPEIGLRKVEALLNYLGYTLSAVSRSRRPTLDQLKGRSFHES